MNLLLDIGNSRIKWAMSDGAGLSHAGAAARDAALFNTLSDAWRQLPAPARILAANVAGAEFAEVLSRWIKVCWGVPVEYVVVEQGWGGLEIAYAQPLLFGVDRWLALIAARHLHGGDVCVIDCGTAVTIDAVTAAGRHLGGVIVPGVTLMQGSLLQRSPGVSRGVETAALNTPELLGCDTRSGIELGALYAVAGAITHTLERIKVKMAEPITSIITGGDAEVVLHETAAVHQHHPHLVLQGLQYLADH